MKMNDKIKLIQWELEQITNAYVIIYKTKHGSWRVGFMTNDNEKEEIKSILMNSWFTEIKGGKG